MKGGALKRVDIKCLEGGALNSLTCQKLISYFDGLITAIVCYQQILT